MTSIAPWQDEELASFRETVRRFTQEEVMPFAKRHDAQGFIDRDVWQKAGAAGILGADLPEEFGGSAAHFGYAATVVEELAHAGANSFRVSLSIHMIAAHYLVAYGTDEQKAEWLPRLISGEALAGVAMSEPVGGSDLQAGRTRAIADGDYYVVNGSKTFITNGSCADLLLLALKTDPSQRARGTSLLLFDTRTEGFEVGQRLEKLGLHSSDTCELFFNDCRIPRSTLLGTQEGQGFFQMMEQLVYERVIAAAGAIGTMEYAYELTRDYVRERQAFGKALVDFQNTRFVLADVKTDMVVARTFVDAMSQRMISGTMDAETASMAKLWMTEKTGVIVDRCLQLFGGYGYITEYPIARLYADARIERIYGGTSEIMKDIIARTL